MVVVGVIGGEGVLPEKMLPHKLGLCEPGASAPTLNVLTGALFWRTS